MIEDKNEVNKNLEKALQALEQTTGQSETEGGRNLMWIFIVIKGVFLYNFNEQE